MSTPAPRTRPALFGPTFTAPLHDGIGVFEDDGPPLCVVPFQPEIGEEPAAAQATADRIAAALDIAELGSPAAEGTRHRWGITRTDDDGAPFYADTPDRPTAERIAARDRSGMTLVVCRTLTSTGWHLPYDTPAGTDPHHRALHDAHQVIALDGTLTDVPLTWLLDTIAVGSHDWTWDDETADLIRHDRRTLDDLIGHITDFGEIPGAVVIGPDGRLHDGHHRVVAAQLAGLEHIRALLRPGAPTPPPSHA
jgi:hypothetical protein